MARPILRPAKEPPLPKIQHPAGHPPGRGLDSYETILNFIRTTKTKTGLKVNARLVKKQYPKGIKISDPAMALLNIKKSSSLPKWNYTLRPSKNGE